MKKKAIEKLTSMLSLLPDTHVISDSLNQFTDLLDENSDAFLEMSKDLAHMIQSFIHDIITWKEMIFYTGAPSINFLDNSISTNVQTIKALFVVNETIEENLDDIFDF